MKKFAFPLDRALAWRRTQSRIEESKLERLHAELRAIEKRESLLLAERSRSERALIDGAAITGADLGLLDAFRRYVAAQGSRNEAMRADCRKRIEEQMQKLAAKRLEIRLLERLREKKIKQWNADFSREIDQQAAETFISRWRPPTRE